MNPQPPRDPALRAALEELAELVVEDVLREEGEVYPETGPIPEDDHPGA